MPYVIPQVQVYQDFETSPQAQSGPLSAHISGPHAQLVRFAQSDEQANGLLGIYDPLEDTAFTWPTRAAGGIIDQDYVKLFVKNAILRYYQEAGDSDGGVVKVANQPNQVRSSVTNFATNGTYSRDALLYDRDVKAGDIVKLRFTPESGSPVTMWSYVTGFAGDPIAAIIGTPTRDTANGATGTASATYSQTRGPFNAVEISAASAAQYNPYPTGKVTESYTIIVTGSSVNGDFTKATLRVISASGLDDQESITPSHHGTATPIGTLGATITFTAGGGSELSESAQDQGVSPDDLLVGQKFLLTVHAAFTQTAAPTAAGTYTGPTTMSYIIEVVTGAKFNGGVPQIKVSTTQGTDLSGPTNVPAAGQAIGIGSYGVTVTFTGTGLALGDKFYVPVTSKTTGPIRTLVLANTIPSTVPDNTPADISLFIENTALQINLDKIGEAPQVNFSMTAEQITVNSDVTAFDPSWTIDGVPAALPLDSDSGQGYSEMFVEYRAWIPDLANNIGEINDVGQIDDLISGALDPDNPLKWGVFQALTNSNGADVAFTSVADPDDVDSWTAVLDQLLGSDQVYGLVPLTYNGTVLDLFVAHVNDQSSPENGRWRVAWFNLQGMPTIPIVSAGSTIAGYTAATSSDGNTVLAKITQDPNFVGTSYTIVNVPAGNGVFITNGVQAGDVVRAQFANDGFGDYTYQEYVVDAVLTEESIRLLTGPATPVDVASKIEIWRNLNATDEATAIAKVAGSYGNRRVRAVWPDQITSSGTIMDGYHLCAALAGLRSGILPQQGMTRLAISGFTDVSRTTRKFSQPQLDILAGSGTWIVTQSSAGEVYTRHALTTGSYDDINQREEMLTSNVDSISYQFQSAFDPYIGITNVTPSLISQLNLDILALVDQLTTGVVTNPLLGGQLISATIAALRQHLTLKDRVVLILDIQPPYPFNNFEEHLVIPAATAVTAAALTGAQTVVTTPTTTG